MTGVFAGERAIVIGAGASGLAAARVLAEEGARVRISERGAGPGDAERAELAGLGVELHTGGHVPEHLEGATLAITSPGVPERAPVLSWIRDRGLPLWSELELGARLCEVPYVAITGTNGKTTTTELVAAVMRAAGLDAVACGNIGHPFSLAARETRDALAVEASSFQLRFSESLHPRVSVLLNLADDHLDWHLDRAAYADAKARIFRNQGERDTHVGNRDDPAAAELSARARCAHRWFGLGAPGDGETGFDGKELVARTGGPGSSHGLTPLGDVVDRSAGFRADAAAAAAAALAFGLEAPAISEGISRVGLLPHRGEVVATIGRLRFVDDSKATNPQAALAALDGIADGVLIAGGRAKGVDLSPLAEAAPRLVGVVAIGEAAPEIVRVFEGRLSVHRAGSIEDAVRLGFELAPPEGTVILAPACASQDQFRDYRERGDRFAAAAVRLAREVAVRG